MTRASKYAELMRAWALTYAQLGWPVFPLRVAHKAPLTSDGFKSATTNEAQILEWWTQFPGANIGLRTGMKFDVLDLDGGEGYESLRSYLKDLNIDYRHQGPVSRTGKGQHLLFLPTGKGNGAGLLPKVDFRGRGGYIVAPPSLHPRGEFYEWDEDRYWDAPLPAAPEWLLTLLNREIRDPNEKAEWALKINPEDPQPYAVYLQLVAEQKLPANDVPRGLRMRSERPNILEVCAAKGIPLTPSGSYYKTRCLFHDDSTPSMTIYPDNTFHCFGCGAHGDSYDLERDPPTHI